MTIHALNAAVARTYTLVGGKLCVDFANTVYPQDRAGGSIASWEELVGFLQATNLIRKDSYQRLVDLEVSARDDVAAAYLTALELREAICAALAATAGKRPVAAWCVQAINRVLRYTEGYEQLVPEGSKWRLGYVETEKRLEWLLAAIARSAAEVIAEGPGAPVRKCIRPECVLYFYDMSRTGKRKWCQMAICGNRAKVAAFVKRRKKGSK